MFLRGASRQGKLSVSSSAVIESRRLTLGTLAQRRKPTYFGRGSVRRTRPWQATRDSIALLCESDPEASDEHGLKALTDSLKAGGTDTLVILAKPMGNSSDRPVNPDQVDTFNSALKLMGVGPIKASTLNQGRQQLVIMGMPWGGDGSGWSSQVFDSPQSVFNGWLMPDSALSSHGAPQFRVQPERAAFDTSQSKTSTTNTMSIRDNKATASLSGGQTAAFQVVELDPIKFTIVRSDAFGRNGELEAMAARLNEIRDHGTGYVAVQSIGHAVGFPAVTSALIGFGANPHTFSTVDGSYAFIGGTKLARSETVESSSALANGESGTLSGRASIRGDGVFKPVISVSTDSHESEMYDIAFRAPTPWPNKPETAVGEADDPDAEGYREALAYISANVSEFKGRGSDLRSAYTANLDLDYDAAGVHLSDLKYPGDGRTCAQGAGRDTAPGSDFSRSQFCNLQDELQLEFGWLDETQRLFDKWQQALYRAGGNEQVDLQGIGTDIETAVAPSPAAEILIDIGEFALLVAEDAALASESVTPLAVIEAAAAVYELATTLSSDADTSVPLGDQLKAKVGDMSLQVANHISDTANGLDSLQQVIVSDYGRLQALGSVAGTPGWTDTKNAMAGNLRSAGRKLFYSGLMPVPYGVYLLRKNTTGGVEPTADNCFDLKYVPGRERPTPRS